MSVKMIEYLNKEADYKPTCTRCGYSVSPVWVLNEHEWVCEACLTKEEIKYILESYNA